LDAGIMVTLVKGRLRAAFFLGILNLQLLVLVLLLLLLIVMIVIFNHVLILINVNRIITQTAQRLFE
jgi:low temperature requirement protein LtrA